MRMLQWAWASLLFSAVYFLLGTAARAEVFAVFSDEDSFEAVTQEGTLRYALAQVPAFNEPNLIIISAGLNIVTSIGFQVLGWEAGITIEGNGATITTVGRAAQVGLTVDAENVTLRNTRITGFANRGIAVARANFTMTGCTVDNNGAEGVYIAETLGFPADNPVIGGLDPALRNYIHGNSATEILRGGLRLDRVRGARILNNYFGILPDGVTTAPNGSHAIIVENSPETEIGVEGAGNVISGNGGAGIFLTGTATEDVGIYANIIGLSADGATVLPNNQGVSASSSSKQRDIIVGRPGGGNVVSGNATVNINMENVDAFRIQGNFIGTDPTGMEVRPAIAANSSGIYAVSGSRDFLIGGMETGEGNIIAASKGNLEFHAAIRVGGGSFNGLIQQNHIGVAADGFTPLGNATHGVMVQARDTMVGGAELGMGNIIAHNEGFGVQVKDASGTLPVRVGIRRNRIHSNALGGIDIAEGANENVPPPVVTFNLSLLVGGQAQGDGIVDVFTDSGNQGATFWGSAEVANGLWQLTPIVLQDGITRVTAIYTDTEGNSSRFSAPYLAGGEGEGQTPEGEDPEGEGEVDSGPLRINVPAGDVQALVAAFETARDHPGVVYITLEGGIYAFGEPVIGAYGPSALPDVRGTIVLIGNQATILRNPDAPPFRIFTIEDEADAFLTLIGVKVRGGFALGAPGEDGRGGGVYNGGRLQVIDGWFFDNVAEGGAAPGPDGNGGNAFGGALYNAATGELYASTLRLFYNSARGGAGGANGRGGNARGGGIHAAPGSGGRVEAPGIHYHEAVGGEGGAGNGEGKGGGASVEFSYLQIDGNTVILSGNTASDSAETPGDNGDLLGRVVGNLRLTPKDFDLARGSYANGCVQLPIMLTDFSHDPTGLLEIALSVEMSGDEIDIVGGFAGDMLVANAFAAAGGGTGAIGLRDPGVDLENAAPNAFPTPACVGTIFNSQIPGGDPIDFPAGSGFWEIDNLAPPDAEGFVKNALANHVAEIGLVFGVTTPRTEQLLAVLEVPITAAEIIPPSNVFVHPEVEMNYGPVPQASHYTYRDGEGKVRSEAFDISPRNARFGSAYLNNRPPVFQITDCFRPPALSGTTVPAFQSFSCDILAVDPDGDDVTLEVEIDVSAGTFFFQDLGNGRGILTGTPIVEGWFGMGINATDSRGARAYQSFFVEVINIFGPDEEESRERDLARAIRGLETHFDDIDADGDGEITLRELLDNEFVPVSVVDFFESLNADGEGGISRDDLAQNGGLGATPNVVQRAAARGLVRDLSNLDSNGDGQLSPDEARSGLQDILDPPGGGKQAAKGDEPDFIALLFAALDANGDGLLSVGELRAVVGGPAAAHAIDTNGDGAVSLSELLRAIQFYNSNGYGCAANPGATEDGYTAGPGGEDCLPHDADYNPRDWRVTLTELLRTIQFYNSGGYRFCPLAETEDGYCPGPA